MKKNLAFILSFISIFAFSQVKWMTMDEALAAQKNQPKKILIDFYTTWCTPCKIMADKTYDNPIISKFLNENYYPVKFNSEGKEKVSIYGKTFSNPNFSENEGKNPIHEFAKFMNVNAIPSIVFLDEKSDLITILQGTFTAKELEPYLPFFSNEVYKKITSNLQWENYQKKFKSKIKE